MSIKPEDLIPIVPNPKPLTPLPKLYGMPAKSFSWRVNGLNDEDSTYALISYAKHNRGKMTKVDGEWVGTLSCRIKISDKETIEITGSALEGYPNTKTCANQIWYKFCRDARSKGFGFW
jgi:hypothetical protein